MAKAETFGPGKHLARDIARLEKKLCFPRENMTMEKAKQLKHGEIIHLNHSFNADGTCTRFRVTGKVKIWKRDPNRVQVPIKHGLYLNAYLNETNLRNFHSPEDCTNPKG